MKKAITENDRLTLCPIERSDLISFLPFFYEDEKYQVLAMMDEKAADKYLLDTWNAYNDKLHYYNFIIDNVSGKVVGIVGHQLNYYGINLGIHILEENRRQGYATDSISLYVNSRLSNSRQEITATIDERNDASIALFEKLGFSLLETRAISDTIDYSVKVYKLQKDHI